MSRIRSSLNGAAACGQTARDGKWVNADLLPGIAVNSGANFRIIQLVQDGFVQIQP